ncbi:unnamed protein product, partial [Amoebophrya sp. A120]
LETYSTTFRGLSQHVAPALVVHHEDPNGPRAGRGRGPHSREEGTQNFAFLTNKFCRWFAQGPWFSTLSNQWWSKPNSTKRTGDLQSREDHAYNFPHLVQTCVRQMKSRGGVIPGDGNISLLKIMNAAFREPLERVVGGEVVERIMLDAQLERDEVEAQEPAPPAWSRLLHRLWTERVVDVLLKNLAVDPQVYDRKYADHLDFGTRSSISSHDGEPVAVLDISQESFENERQTVIADMFPFATTSRHHSDDEDSQDNYDRECLRLITTRLFPISGIVSSLSGTSGSHSLRSNGKARVMLRNRVMLTDFISPGEVVRNALTVEEQCIAGFLRYWGRPPEVGDNGVRTSCKQARDFCKRGRYDRSRVLTISLGLGIQSEGQRGETRNSKIQESIDPSFPVYWGEAADNFRSRGVFQIGNIGYEGLYRAYLEAKSTTSCTTPSTSRIRSRGSRDRPYEDDPEQVQDGSAGLEFRGGMEEFEKEAPRNASCRFALYKRKDNGKEEEDGTETRTIFKSEVLRGNRMPLEQAVFLEKPGPAVLKPRVAQYLQWGHRGECVVCHGHLLFSSRQEKAWQEVAAWCPSLCAPRTPLSAR